MSSLSVGLSVMKGRLSLTGVGRGGGTATSSWLGLVVGWGRLESEGELLVVWGSLLGVEVVVPFSTSNVGLFLGALFAMGLGGLQPREVMIASPRTAKE